MVLEDNHLHTDFSDGLDTMEAMVKAAVGIGLKRICFTDHVRRDSLWVPQYVSQAARLQEKYQGVLSIRVGVEAKILDHAGTLDCPAWVLRESTIEKVAAIHRIPAGDGTFIARKDIPANRALAFECYLAAVRGLQKSAADRLAHPFSLFGELGIKRTDTAAWRRIETVMQQTNMRIEYNVKYDDSMVPEAFWTRFRDRLVYGSDSHSAEQLRECWKKRFSEDGRKAAREGEEEKQL